MENKTDDIKKDTEHPKGDTAEHYRYHAEQAQNNLIAMCVIAERWRVGANVSIPRDDSKANGIIENDGLRAEYIVLGQHESTFKVKTAMGEMWIPGSLLKPYGIDDSDET